MTKQIWFIRHGQSLSNVGGSFGEPSAIPLTKIGIEQAKIVSQTLVDKPSAIILSSYDRTHETARPTIERWPDVPCEIWPIHEFTYLSFKKLGVTNVHQRREHVLAYWRRQDPDYKHGEDAESFKNLIQRVDQTLELIKTMSHEKVYAFSHGQFLGSLFYRLENPDADPLEMTKIRTYSEQLDIPNASIAHYSFYEDGTNQRHSLSVEHLKAKAS